MARKIRDISTSMKAIRRDNQLSSGADLRTRIATSSTRKSSQQERKSSKASLNDFGKHTD